MSRMTRHQISTEPPTVDLERPGNMCKFPANQYGKRIVVAEDGTITIDKKAYADDVVAMRVLLNATATRTRLMNAHLRGPVLSKHEHNRQQ